MSSCLRSNRRGSLEVQGAWRRTLETGISSGFPISRYECLAAFVPPLSQQKRNLGG